MGEVVFMPPRPGAPIVRLMRANQQANKPGDVSATMRRVLDATSNATRTAQLAAEASFVIGTGGEPSRELLRDLMESAASTMLDAIWLDGCPNHLHGLRMALADFLCEPPESA